jgi:type III secretory pathway lipoprotein EscJ
MSRERRLYRLIFTLVVLMHILVGCEGVVIIEERSQREAIEIVALLHDNGINATIRRESGSKGRYGVAVDSAYRAQAQALLFSKGFPKESEASFEELTGSRGLIPASREADQLRLDRALAAELEDMVRSHPSVASARAIVRVNYRKSDQEPAVSLLVQERDDLKVVAEAIREMVVRAVPGVKREAVLVSVQPGEKHEGGTTVEGVRNDSGKVVRTPLVPFFFWFNVPSGERAGLALSLFACIFIVVLASALGGYWLGFFQGSKSGIEGMFPDIGGVRALKNDAKGRKDLPSSTLGG